MLHIKYQKTQSKISLENVREKALHEYIKTEKMLHIKYQKTQSKISLENAIRETLKDATTIFLPKLQELRSRVAWAEILTFFHPDICIPKIIELSLYYLKDDFIIEWLSWGKMKDDKGLVKRFVSAIQIDRRTTIKQQEFDKYLAYFKYCDFVEIIEQCRTNSSMEPFFNSPQILWQTYRNVSDYKKFGDSAPIDDGRHDFKQFCDKYENLVLREKKNESVTATEIMEGEEMIASSDAFRQSKKKIKKDLKKHTKKQIQWVSSELSGNKNYPRYNPYSLTILERFSSEG